MGFPVSTGTRSATEADRSAFAKPDKPDSCFHFFLSSVAYCFLVGLGFMVIKQLGFSRFVFIFSLVRGLVWQVEITSRGSM